MTKWHKGPMMTDFQRVSRLRRDLRGVAALEFALVAPMLLLLIFGGAEVGIVLNQYISLTNATIVGAMQFAFGAGVDVTPVTDATASIHLAAPGLTPLTITYSVNGTACATDAACNTALGGGSGYVTVSTSYSCVAINNIVAAFNILPNCTLTSQQTERIQ
jgi:Flp pilus assembly protein TadG